MGGNVDLNDPRYGSDTNMTLKNLSTLLFASVLSMAAGTLPACAEKIVISNWDGYMPKDMAEKFKAETGIDLEIAVHATNAVTELKTNNERENPPKPDLRDPKVRQREFVQQFEEGFLSLQELAPALKKRSVSQVLALLGPPNRIFGDGTEIGYVDKAIDPVTSKRGMFIISFESGAVANLRVEYAGRRTIP